jgi:hypothetical protein
LPAAHIDRNEWHVISAYLRKPFVGGVLLEAVRSLLNQ